MKKAIILFALVALVAVPAMAREMVRTDAVSGPELTLGRADAELMYDDGTFEGFGTSPDWTDITLGVFEAPTGGPWTLTTFRVFMFGLADHEVMMDDTADMVTPPAAPYGTGVFFNPGTADFASATWVDVDMTGLGLVYNAGDIIAIGTAFDGADGIGLDDSCAMAGTCGVYWAQWSGLWGLDSDYGYNDGLRVVLTGPTPNEEVTLSAVKSLY